MRSDLYFAVKHACGDVAFESGGRDYTLQQVVSRLHAQGHKSAVTTDNTIVLDGESLSMYISICNEACHTQYSSQGQWWPLPDSI